MEHIPPLKWRGRYLESFLGATSGGDDVANIGRVHLVPVPVPEVLTVDQIIYIKGGVVAGNLRAGIYRDPDGDGPDGDGLLVDSGGVAVSAFNNRKQAVAIDPTVIEPPMVWGALEFSDATMEIHWAQGFAYLGDEPTSKYYDLGAFGALSDPCPPTAITTKPVNLWIRVVI